MKSTYVTEIMTMKIGSNLSFKDHARVAKSVEIGYDYVETALNGLAVASSEDIDAFVNTLKVNNTTCPVVNCFFPGKLKLTGEEVDYSAIDEYLDSSLALSGKIGFKIVVFGSGGSRRVPEGFDTAKATEQLIYLCSEHIAPYMKKYGLVCAVEELNRLECNILTTCAETVELIRAVNKPEIKLLYDYYHAGMENEPVSDIRGYADLIVHCHIASPLNKRAFPRSGDGDNYGEFFNILRECGYKSKLVTIEGHDNGEYLRSSIDALNLLKSL